MKNFYPAFLFCSFIANAQLDIITNETPLQIFQESFADPNTILSTLKFNGSEENATIISDQFSRFQTTNEVVFGMEAGIIMTNGQTINAYGPNNNSGGFAPVPSVLYNLDPDLALMSEVASYHHSVIEFDFIPTGSISSFQYVFASEEYPEWTNSNFNDVFGIFISGPGISGPFTNDAVNIAIVPDTAEPVSINALNNGSINEGPCEYCEFYITNGTGNTPLVNSLTQFDGYTTILTAMANVQPGETYHLKIGVGDCQDTHWDTAVILLGDSFSSNTLSTPQTIINKLHIYPNPADHFFKISSDEIINEVTISDLLGKVIKHFILNATLVELDVSNLQAGQYVLEISTEGNFQRQKLIVK
jgi:hypothetical protein